MYYKRRYPRKQYQPCAYCKNYCDSKELCETCEQAAKDETIIKDETGTWINNPRKGNEHKFFNPEKIYYIKQNLLNNIEMQFFEYVRDRLNNDFIITPQVNLQTIIDTNTFGRNDELYRNVDFCIFSKDKYYPLVIIELNGPQHYNNPYWIERDKSVFKILQACNLKHIIYKNEDLKLNEDLINLIHNEAQKALKMNE